MNWLLRRLGYRDQEYRGSDFRLRIEPTGREGLYVAYERAGKRSYWDGERIGRKWEGIAVQIPEEVHSEQLPQIVRDLETAFTAMDYGYVIGRKAGVEIVSESERQQAVRELREMGYEIEILDDGKIRQTRREGAPRQDMETIRKNTPRMLSLLHAVRGRRTRFEVLAKSKGF